MDSIVEKVRRSAETISVRVRADIHNFAMPVKIDRQTWTDWLSEEFAKRRMPRMAEEVKGNRCPYTHAKTLAFEILWEMSGFDCPELCIPEALTGDNELAYWRAIAIAANSI